ncbi:MAG: tetratricopeptide repeat protein [Myxococcota bacterium]
MMVLLSELARVDLEQIRRTMEADEDFKELRFFQGNRSNYPRAVDRLSRYIQKMMEPLTRGEVADSLGPLYALREGAAGLKQARDEWRNAHGMDYTVEKRAVCTTAVELQEAWAELGLPAFRRRGLSTGLLEELFKSSMEPLRDGIKHFQSANLGEAENALRLALRQDPGNLEARLLLGDLLRRLDRYGDAVAELDRLIELEHLNMRSGGSGVPRSSTLLHLSRGRACMGRSLLSMGLLNPAVDQLERGLDALDQHQRRYPDESLDPTLRVRVRGERETLHRLLEPLCRSVGDEERAQHHRHLRSLPT